MNRSKTIVLTRNQAVARHANTLGDVYRPEKDAPDAVRRALRRVFSLAIADPIDRRRELRFALARLERERDNVAVSAAFELLHGSPWEAPRLVSYLAAFSAADRVRDEVDSIVARAASTGDEWRVARVVPLAYRTGFSPGTVDALAASLPRLRRSAGWGLALRALALAGRGRQVTREIAAAGTDQRAVLVALRDLDLPLPSGLG